MIDKLEKDIINMLKRNRVGLSINNFIIYIITMKYYIEKGTYKYEDVIMNEKLYEINKEIIRINKLHILEDDLYINKLLKDYKDISSKELLIEYLDSLNSPIKLNNNEEESIAIGIPGSIYLFYDRYGKTTYIYPNNKEDYFDNYKILDEILDINNKYIYEKDIEIDNYKYLYIFDNTPRYRSDRYDNEYTIIDKYVDKIDNIILYTNYNKISNLRACRYLLRNIKTIIINFDRAIIIFNKDINNEISIINYNNDISKDKLLSIVNNNRKQKDVLVKTSVDEIRKNNYRIGFNLYQLENNDKVKDINKIVDENTDYLERLNRINQTVETEINKLLNK